LNALSSLIPSNERIVTIEDSIELQLQQRHVVQLESRPPNVEGVGEATIRDLMRNSLRMRPDRIVIGECRGREALDMMQAMNTGHEGSMTTLHANSPQDALSRLENMVEMSGVDIPLRSLRDQIASSIDIVIQVDRLIGGARRITSVTEVIGMEGDRITTQELFRFKQLGVNEEGQAYGAFEASGILPHAFEQIRAYGVDLSADFFQEREFGVV
jgi:pilus assembly protein CpaF